MEKTVEKRPLEAAATGRLWLTLFSRRVKLECGTAGFRPAIHKGSFPPLSSVLSAATEVRGIMK